MPYEAMRELSSTVLPTSGAQSSDTTASPPRVVLPLLAAYGALAPSPYNTQPWEFRVTAEAVEICLDQGRGAPLGAAAHREPVIGCGAALFNTRVALRHFGYRDRVELFPDPTNERRIARVQAGEPRPQSAYTRALFHAIPRRHTLRARGQGFESRELSAATLDELVAAARASGAWLHLVTASSDRGALADLVFEAGEERVAAAGVLGSEDGLDLPADTPVPEDAERVAHAIAVAEARRAGQLLRAAPAVAILGTTSDEPAAWVAAGEALEHVLLRAASQGIFAAYANQPLRIPDTRPWVKAVARHSGEPHVILALGFAPAPDGPPRRPVSDLLG
jgi:hypothetical protein